MRLSEIDPDALGEEVQTKVLHHIHSLAFALTGKCARLEPTTPQIKLLTKDLAEYAKEGRTLDAPVQEYLISIAPPMWTRAVDSGLYTTPEFDEWDPDAAKDDLVSRLCCVMRAALARESVAQGQDIAPNDLAVLTGLSADHVRLLIRRGEIKATQDDKRWTVSAKTARAWLRSRQVPGF